MLLAIALVPIFSIQVPFLQRSIDFSVQLMLGYLVLGLIFLILGKKRLLFTSFICCGILCLFLKQSSNTNLIFPKVTNNEKLTIAHFNTTSATIGYKSLLDAVIESKADIVSFQEVTPDWDAYLKQNLADLYPFNASNVRIDPYGMEIFSKLPIQSYDTFHFEEIPHQIINVNISEKEQINIISAHVLPPVGKRLNERAKMHLNKIASKVSSIESPSIVLGDFNLVYWSNEIVNFREEAQLENSRRDISQNLLNVPYDHIFFSNKLECTNFGDISDTTSNHLGIIGTYQIKTSPDIKEGRMPGILR
jgi:endonuclease/exonuclease/phosphatase (EEP) superfamily protein YafD